MLRSLINLFYYLLISIGLFSFSLILVYFKKPDYNKDFAGLVQRDFILPFKITSPESTLRMPKKLKEISGISYYKGKIIAINDERADLYVIDMISGDIEQVIDFGKKDDYEAITHKGDVAYVAESNGNIKEIDLSSGKKIGEYKTDLKKKNNVEGMFYDHKHDQLIMACKGKTKKKSKKNTKGLYAFNLKTKDKKTSLVKEFRINHADTNLIKLNMISNVLVDLNTNSRLSSFAPSGIDIDPLTQDRYMVSNNGKLLVVTDSLYDLRGIYFLPRQLYGQPEGLCFDDMGGLYISNEARSTSANIKYFPRQNVEPTEEANPIKDIIEKLKH